MLCGAESHLMPSSFVLPQQNILRGNTEKHRAPRKLTCGRYVMVQVRSGRVEHSQELFQGNLESFEHGAFDVCISVTYTALLTFIFMMHDNRKSKSNLFEKERGKKLGI